MIERISDDESAYHQRVYAQFIGAQGAFEGWMNHLFEKYQLKPMVDRIFPDGRILRALPDESPID